MPSISSNLLSSYWFFDCECPRCLDPTEMGSLMSAVKCSDCESGNLLPIDPKDLDSDWLCSQCKHRFYDVICICMYFLMNFVLDQSSKTFMRLTLLT